MVSNSLSSTEVFALRGFDNKQTGCWRRHAKRESLSETSASEVEFLLQLPNVIKERDYSCYDLL